MSGYLKEEVRWGIIGVGDVCEVKSGPAFQKIANSRLIAVMRRNAEKAADYARRHNVPKWYSKAEDLINDAEVNAIYVATPPDTHTKYAIMAAEAGKPAYVEKPMARTYKECLEMVRVFEKLNIPLFVAYYRRALPYILLIKKLLKEKVIGDVRFVDVKICMRLHKSDTAIIKDANDWRVIPEIAGGGYFYDLACHQLDALDFLFGPIVKANGIATNQSGLYKAEDITTGSFVFENGVMGNGVWAFNTSAVSEVELSTIVGSEGEIRFSFFGDHKVLLKRESSEQWFEPEIPQHIQQPLIQTVVDDLLGRGTCPSTGKTASKTNWVMEQICNNQTN